MMTKTIPTFIVLLLAVFSSALGSIPSFGTQTNGAIRGALGDDEFLINPAEGVITDTPNFRVEVAELGNFPALAGQDVQTQFIRVTIKAMQPFFPHYHPRGAEYLTLLRGTLRASFRFEGLEPRIVTNDLNVGESTVFPVALTHDVSCISTVDCEFVSTFNSADPGLVPVSA